MLTSSFKTHFTQQFPGLLREYHQCGTVTGSTMCRSTQCTSNSFPTAHHHDFRVPHAVVKRVLHYLPWTETANAHLIVPLLFSQPRRTGKKVAPFTHFRQAEKDLSTSYQNLCLCLQTSSSSCSTLSADRKKSNLSVYSLSDSFNDLKKTKNHLSTSNSIIIDIPMVYGLHSTYFPPVLCLEGDH